MTLDRPFRSFRQSRVIYDFYYLTSLDNLSFFRLCRFVFYRTADNHTSTHPVISRKWDSLWVRALEQRLFGCPGIPVRDAIHFHWTHPFLWLYYNRFSLYYQFAESTKSKAQNWAKKRMRGFPELGRVQRGNASDFPVATGKVIKTVFSGDTCLGKNSSHGASVRGVSTQAECAQHRASLLTTQSHKGLSS